MDFFFSSRRRHTRLVSDWSSDVCSSDLWRIFHISNRLFGNLLPQRGLNSLAQFRGRLVIRGSIPNRAHERAMRFVGLIAVATVPQMLFDLLVSDRIQFTIQITIHQVFTLFAVHLFLFTHPSRQIFPKFGARTSQPRHHRAWRNLRDFGYFLVRQPSWWRSARISRNSAGK